MQQRLVPLTWLIVPWGRTVLTAVPSLLVGGALVFGIGYWFGGGDGPNVDPKFVHLVDQPVMEKPPVSPGKSAQLPDDAEVIGVAVEGHFRAYLVEALVPREWHVVNDELGSAPVTVSYCDRTDCVQAYTGPRGEGALHLAVGGYMGVYDVGSMLLRVGSWHYRQDTRQPLEKDAPPFPYAQAHFERTTWKKWHEAHPDTDVFVGEPLSAPAQAPPH
jgi:hypothetical protein